MEARRRHTTKKACILESRMFEFNFNYLLLLMSDSGACPHASMRGRERFQFD
jgi:hypothetical protein